MIEKIKQVLKWSKDMTEKAIYECNQKTLEFRSILKKKLIILNTFKHHCDFMIEKIRNANKVPIYYSIKEVSCPEISQKDLNLEFKNLYKNVFITKVSSSIDSSQKYKEIEDSLSSLLNKEFVDEPDSYLDFFMANTKVLVSFDIKSASFNKKTINLQENQGILTSICRISTDEIFISGGNINIGQTLSETLDNCFIINTKNSSVTILPKGYKRCAAQPLLFNKKIYIFGGELYSQNIKESHMFDLNSKTWKILAPLIDELSCTSTVLLRENEILLIGTNVNGKRYFLGYNTISNTYFDYSLNYSDKNFHINILIQSDDKVFIIVRNIIFVTEANNLRSWKITEKSCVHFGIISQVVVRENKAYFIDSKQDVFMFCLKTFHMSNILKIA
ncbi:hypothetical protein SteCoe_2639 [Stentor coeruleus]|uniref:Kelch motif family protein n=1 Tax=Stentor coeruleus TaxID=5963 RepID=A0A1R2CZ66_9CILI|nr:hypothetical protein SteCoe_2639 [Stentor coeruleus]